MELSISNIKKFLIFSYYFGKRKPPQKFFKFKETETLESFLYLGKILKIHSQNNFLYFEKWNFPALILKKSLIFCENKNHIKIPYISRNETF